MSAPLDLGQPGLLAEGTSFLQALGELGDQQQLQRLVKLTLASIQHRADPAQQHLATRATFILGGVLGGAAASGPLAAEAARAASGIQQAATTQQEQANWVHSSRICKLSLAAPHCRQAPPHRRSRLPAAAPSNYLAGVQSTLVALACSRLPALAPAEAAAAAVPGPASEGGTDSEQAAALALQASMPPHPRPAALLRRALRDERQVAAELSPDASDPNAACLQLRPLAAGRTQAAIAAKLAGKQPARLQAKLLRRQQAAEQAGKATRVLRAGLLSSQRAALLAAGGSSGAWSDPVTALQGILRGGLQEHRQRRQRSQTQGQQQRQTGQPGAAPAVQQGEALQGEHPAVELRRRLAQGVTAQHKELRKAWREKKQREQRERLEALRGNNVEEYMRLVAGMAGKRNARLETLLSQTDGCLRQLAARLRAAGAGDALLATAAAGGSPSLTGRPQAGASPAPGAHPSAAIGAASGGGSGGSGSGEGIAALEQSHEAWNQLAQAFQAEVAQQPKLLTGGELREYQMKGLRWLAGLHARGLNGILADEMGLGKTIQVISLVCHLVGEVGERRPFLIAVPSSVLPNWEKELEVWAPGLKVVCYRGDPEAREEVWRRQMRSGRGGAAGPGTHVVLTTYDFLMNKNDRPRLARVHWSYICVDEGHRLKNAGCKLNAELRGYTADHRLLLTGTPLQNNISELWSLLNFLMPALFDSGEDFQQWFGGADRRNAAGGAVGAVGGDSSDEDEEGAAAAARAEAAMLTEEEALIVTNRLHQVLRPFMLRRLKETVASELPQKREHLLPVLPSPYQQALFRLMEAELQRSSSSAGGRGSLKGVSNVLMEMRNICNHPLISRLHPQGAETGLPQHCLPAEVRLCAKLELLDRVLVKLRAGGHKVLLFCTMTRALDVISDYLDWRGFSHLRMDGATAAADRGELVSRFNDPAGGAFVFLLSIRAGGVGLNLQGADTVIMYDTDWNPQMDLQAQARAHRMGQTREVLVLRLKTVGTVEERVVGVASDKAQLADRSITGGFFDGKTSAEERQRYLLETIRTSTAAATAQRGAAGAAGAGSGDGGAGAGELSDAQLNALLARVEGEEAVFEAEDRHMQAVELSSWQSMQSSTGSRARQQGQQQGLGHYSRLAGAEEVAPLVAAAAELLQPKKDEDEGKEMGRGKRQRGAAAYRDLPEREFNRLCREGVAQGEAPVPLLAPADKAAAAAAVASEQPAAAQSKRRKAAGAGEAAEAAQQAPAGTVTRRGMVAAEAAAAAAAMAEVGDVAVEQVAVEEGRGGQASQQGAAAEQAELAPQAPAGAAAPLPDPPEVAPAQKRRRRDGAAEQPAAARAEASAAATGSAGLAAAADQEQVAVGEVAEAGEAVPDQVENQRGLRRWRSAAGIAAAAVAVAGTVQAAVLEQEPSGPAAAAAEEAASAGQMKAGSLAEGQRKRQRGAAAAADAAAGAAASGAAAAAVPTAEEAVAKRRRREGGREKENSGGNATASVTAVPEADGPAPAAAAAAVGPRARRGRRA